MWCALILVFVLGLILYCSSNQVAQVSATRVPCVCCMLDFIVSVHFSLHPFSLRNQINTEWISILALTMLQTMLSFQKQIKQRFKWIFFSFLRFFSSWALTGYFFKILKLVSSWLLPWWWLSFVHLFVYRNGRFGVLVLSSLIVERRQIYR